MVAPVGKRFGRSMAGLRACGIISEVTNMCLCLFCVKNATAQCLISHPSWVETWNDCIDGATPEVN